MNGEIIKEIIFTGEVLYREGLVNSHAGNISVREGDHLYITKTGSMLGYLKEDDIVKLPIFYETVKDRIASSELIVHREIYKNTEAKAVIHAHPVHAVVISFLTENIFVPVDNEGKLFVGEVPILDVEKPSGSKELAEKLSETFKNQNKKIVIVKKHGSFVIGNNLNQALKLTSDLEFCSKVFYLLKKR
ncbi:MAG TPA: aldolase [Persephonella sp.]|uniref:L-fuculose phosphate aldolase n=1 Tax=Persephonella marina (strain DSM 14350 / EX-H1) TaxID=123214 RepID=C0QPT7_PERMH|nr:MULTISPECIES: class II aldolase/adducin family protein [Persephonella]ACO03919.1 L-fuculose phosphate aldolase [Persephonella marina EX-H1]HCB69702.1 aldolase [Persephonella sp.]